MSVTQQQLDYLKAMGIPVWIERAGIDPAIFEAKRDKVVDEKTRQQKPVQAPPSLQASLQDSLSDQIIPIPKASNPRIHNTAPPPEYSSEYLFSQIDQKTTTNQSQTAAFIVESVTKKVATKTFIDCSSFNWQALQAATMNCQQCDLYNKRTQIVFGEGVENAIWMIIGDAPKEEEDTQGRPFMDRQGALLNNMLLAIGLDRSRVYIANTLKCRPPNNRDAKKPELKACDAYLKRQIELVNPSLILVVGRIATQHLLNTKEPIARLRGQVHSITGIDIPVVVTYHPAYLLRQPRDKYKSWQDLKFAHSVLSN